MRESMHATNLSILSGHDPKQRQANKPGAWTISSIRSAIDSHSSGDFSSVTRLSKLMLQDQVINSAINKRASALIRAEFNFKEYSGLYKSIYIKNKVKQLFNKWVKRSTLKELIKQYLLLGVSVAYVEWQNIDGIWIPDIQKVDTENLRYEPFTKRWYLQTKTGSIDIHPGDGNWILFGDWEYASITGLISALAEDWYTKKSTENDLREANAAHSENILVISEDDTGKAATQTDKDTLAAEVDLQKQGKVLMLAPGHQAQILEAITNYKPEAFQQTLKDINTKFVVSILGANLSSELDGAGSYAAAAAHKEVEKNLVESDSYVISEAIHAQLLTTIIYLNWGEGLVSYTPHIQFLVENVSQKQTEFLNKFILAQQALPSNYSFANTEQLFEEHLGWAVERTNNGNIAEEESNSNKEESSLSKKTIDALGI